MIALAGEGADGAIEMRGGFVERAGEIGELVFGVVARQRMKIAAGHAMREILEALDAGGKSAGIDE